MPTTLGSYTVTNCSVTETPQRISLVINLTRLYGSYWMSIFIPSICLVVAAELTLFIDDQNFKAAITVSLTANLVMYTLYRGVQAQLPDASSMKLIDIWLLHGLLMPMVVFVILTTNNLISSHKSSVKPSGIKYGAKGQKKVAFAKKSKLWQSVKFMKLCKVLVPVTSAIFTVSFFILMFCK